MVYVPNDLQVRAAKHYGRKTKRLKEVVIGLRTRDLREANKRKLAVVDGDRRQMHTTELGRCHGAFGDVEAAQQLYVKGFVSALGHIIKAVWTRPRLITTR